MTGPFVIVLADGDELLAVAFRNAAHAALSKPDGFATGELIDRVRTDDLNDLDGTTEPS